MKCSVPIFTQVHQSSCGPKMYDIDECPNEATYELPVANLNGSIYYCAEHATELMNVLPEIAKGLKRL